MTSKPEHPSNADDVPGRWRDVDPMFDGHLETPLLKMTVQQRLDWIDEMMRLRTEWKPVPRTVGDRDVRDPPCDG